MRASSLATLQCMVSNCIPDKEWEVTFKQLITKLEVPAEDNTANSTRVETLLDVCRVAWRLEQRELALRCLELVQDAGASVISPFLRIKLDMCEAIRSLSDLATLSVNKTAKQRLSKKQTEGFIANKKVLNWFSCLL